MLKDLEVQGLIGKIKVRENDQNTGNPERTYYRLNSLIFSPEYQGNDLKQHYIELNIESKNLSYYIKELFIFIKEKGLMDEWTARQALHMEKRLAEKCGNNSDKQDKAFSAMLKAALLYFRLHKRLFNKRNSEEMILLLTSGHYSEFIARVESKSEGGKREGK